MDFIILKVNGQDVSRSSHEDAVRAFQSADEPIVVEVLRRAQQTPATPGYPPPSPMCCPGVKGSSIGGGSRTSSPELVSTAVQTDWMGAWDLAASQEAFHTPPPHMYVIPEADPDESYEDDYLAQEIMDYEEVTLQKSGTRGERLGLTLCYSSVPCQVDDDAPDTEVFISAVEEGGVASRDGRLREGDQILQVNGIDVTTKEQAEALFAASTDAVSLLVTRPSSQQDIEEDLDDNDCGCESTSFIQIPADEYEEEEEGIACSSGAAAVSESASNPSHQDSGLGADLGAECSPEEPADLRMENVIEAQASTSSSEERQLKSRKAKEGEVIGTATSGHVTAEPGYLGSAETSPEDKVDNKGNSVAESSSKSTPMAMIPAQRLDLIDHELYQLNKKMEIIQLECESIAAQKNPSPANSNVIRGFGDSETEHIYETIPEQTESEAEPIYSLPYEPEPIQSSQSVTTKGKSRTLRTCDPILKASKQEDVEQWVKLTGTDPKASKDGESWLKKDTWPHSVDSRSSNESRRRQTVDTGTRAKSKNKCKDSSSGEDKEKDSSSAYNTGESCRSTPLTLELGLSGDPNCGRSESTLVLCPPPPSASTEDRSMQVNLDSDTYSVISCESCRRCMRLPPLSPEHTASPTASPKKPAREAAPPKPVEVEKNLNYVTMIPADTMYTNAANLQQTIWLQQQLFRQALVKQNHNRLSPSSTVSPKSPNPPEANRRTMPACSPAGSYTAPNLNGYQFVSGYGVVNGQPSTCTLPSPQSSSHLSRNTHHPPPPQEAAETLQMEWKVKKRPDGSRYIARRPVRNRLLRDRAMKITEERAGVTTDDDTVSELKVGRYWTREERRKHVEKAKEKRKRQEAVIRAKMHPTKDTQEHDHLARGEERASLSKKKQINIVELSHKKMARKKSSKDAFDDFTTVQEMLVHGNRVAAPVGPSGKMMGLLSVTTV